MKEGSMAMQLSVVEEVPDEDKDAEEVVDSIRGVMADAPLIMNAVRDTETGEMVATDVIRA
jgi:hypothetical protein